MSDPRDDDLLQLRQPPHSEEAEQSLLGAMLLDNQAFERVADIITAEDFYRDDHRRIWRHVARLIESSRGADVVTVMASIEASEDKDRTGGAGYLASLSQNSPGAGNVRRYAELVRERSIQRQLATVATEIADQALSPAAQDVSLMLADAEAKILRIGEATARHNQGPVELKPLLSKVFERIDELYHRDNRSGVTGVPTGYLKLDDMTAGMQPGDLIIVAGRPSMGKTALALNIAEHVSVDCDLPVLVFSMEMSGTQLATRLLGSIAKVDQHKMRTGKLEDLEWGHLSDAMEKLHERPIHIDDSGGLTVLELRARARRLRRRFKKLGLVVVDYLQLMESKERKENRATDIAEISRSLKAMAKELDCPVIALSQLSRRVEERPNKRPMLADLRESGAIEQDADVVLALYREGVYLEDPSAEELAMTELLILKQRNGPIGTVKLTFLGAFTRFENYAGMPGDFTPRPRNARKKAASNFAEA